MDNKEKIDRNEIRQALTDIAEMKAVIKGNIKFLRPILYEKSYIGLCYASAILFLIFFGSMQFVSDHWGSLGSSPLPLRIAYTAAGIAVIIWTTLMKLKIAKKSLEKRSCIASLKTLYSLPEFRFMTADIVCLMCIYFPAIIFIAIQTGYWYLLFSSPYIFFSFILIHYATFMYLSEYRVMGIFSGIIGLVLIFFMRTHYFFWIAGASACFFFLYGTILLFMQKGKPE